MANTNQVNIDWTPLTSAAGMTPALVKKGATQGFKRIKLDWIADTRNEAPIKSGNLRKQINGTSNSAGVTLTNNAVHGGFNYAYYHHEVRGNDYLKRALDEEKVKRTLEEELRKALFSGWGR